MTADTMPARKLADPEGARIIANLGQLGRDLSSEIGRLAQLEETAVTAEGAFRAEYARQYNKADGNMETCKQQAIEQTHDQWLEWQRAALLVRVQRESLKALHARIDIGRTMASREKALASLAGNGDAP